MTGDRVLWRDPIALLREVIGRRGVVLSVLGVVWVIFAFSVLSYEPPTGMTGRFGLAWIDSRAWALMWFVSGVVALYYAARRRRVANDAIGWAVGNIPPMLWCAFYAWSWLWWWATEGFAGSPRAWSGFIVYALVAGLIRTMAGWEDALDPRPGAPSTTGE